MTVHLRFYPISSHMLRLEFYLVLYLWWLWDVYLEMYVIYPLRRFVEIFYACWFETYWRCDDYFLNIYYIRVFYRVNRSRALQTGSLLREKRRLSQARENKSEPIRVALHLQIESCSSCQMSGLRLIGLALNLLLCWVILSWKWFIT